MPSKQYPFIDIAVHEHVRARFAAGEALVLFSDTMDKVLWSNGAGASLFNHDFIYDFLDAGLPAADVTARQIKSTAGQLQNVGDRRSFLMRMTTNFQRVTIQANLEILTDRSGDRVILFSAPLAEKPLPLAQRAKLMLSGFDDPDTHMAVLSSDGAILASSPGFNGLGMTQETLFALVRAVSRDADHLLKRPVPTGRGYLPAAIGKLSDDPVLNLLFCVETAIGQMDPTDDDTFNSTGSELDGAVHLAAAEMQVGQVSVGYDDALDAVSHIEETTEEPVETDAIVETQPPAPASFSDDRPLATGLRMLDSVVEDDMSLSYANETADDLADLTLLHGLDVNPNMESLDKTAIPEEFEAEFHAYTNNVLPDEIATEFNSGNSLSGNEYPEIREQNDIVASEIATNMDAMTKSVDYQSDFASAEFAEQTASTETESAEHADDGVPSASNFAFASQTDEYETVEPSQTDPQTFDAITEFETAADTTDLVSATQTTIATSEEDQSSELPGSEPLEHPNFVAEATSQVTDQETSEQTDEHVGIETAEDGNVAADTSNAIPDIAFSFQRNARPVRFVWKVDADGKFSEISEEFAQAVGPRAAAINDLYFADVARAFKMDPDGKIGDLLQKRDTWSGKTIYWPVEGTSLKVPVDLAALPTYSRSRSFDGFRGFGIVRLVDAIEDADQIGLELGRKPELSAETSNLDAELSVLELVFAEQNETVAALSDMDKAELAIASLEEGVPFERTFSKSDEDVEFPTDEFTVADGQNDAESATDDSSRATPEPVLEERDSAAIEDLVELDGAKAGSDDTVDMMTGSDEVTEVFSDGHDNVLGVDDVAFPENLADQTPVETGKAPGQDEFRGEKPALRIVENPGRRLSDKIVSIDAHRGKSRDGLSLSEQAAFNEIARQLDPFGKRLTPDLSREQDPRQDEPRPAQVQLSGESNNSTVETEEVETTASDASAKASGIADDVKTFIPSRTKSEEYLSASFVDALPLAILVHTGENLIHANPEFFRLTGYESLKQLKDYGGLDALLEQDQSPKTSDETPSMMLVTEQGTLEPVTARLQSIRWEDSNALLLALVPKRTDSERADAVKAMAVDESADPTIKINALTIEVEELRSILETATDGVVIVGQDGEIRSMNKSASALFNFDDEDTRGKSFAMLFAHESQKAVMDYLSGLAGHGVASVLNDGREVIGREASGGFIPIFMTMGRLSSSNGYCAVIRDITQWKRTEEELRTAKRAAETANAHKSEFLARVSHEIRTPLNAIIGFSDMMATERLGPIGHPRYVEYSDDIGRSGRHVLDIVNDLLDISKIEAGEMDLDFTAVELNEVISEAVSLVQPQVNSQRVIIRTSLSQSVPNIVADQRSIKQIAINILANAIRYTPSGGQIVVSTAYETNGSVVLRIRDTGVGMTRTELEQALKPFRQVTTGSRKRGDGTGLGLPLTKAMVDANRANFAISSTPNEGTLVEISFPSPRVLAN